MSKSFQLGPPKDSPGLLFLKAQFWHGVQWPHNSTNLAGKVAIITGSTGGLGLEASRQLLSYGLSGLIMAVRSTEKGEKIATSLRSEYPNADIMVWFLEMESYDSIQALARRADAELARLDIVILNAGIQVPYFTTVSDTGHERYIQVNYLSTVLLAILLLPILKTKTPAGSPGRLTIVSSGTARGANITEFNEPVLPTLDDSSRSWRPVERYAVSKLLGHLFVINLMQYVNAEDVIVNLVDPGLVKNTDLQRGIPSLIAVAFSCMKAIFGRSLPVGASTYVDAVAVKGKESHGCFLSSWRISSYAAFAYTAEGATVRDQLWQETMKEFEFVRPQEILDGLRH
ncbi:hypothetical protein BGZ63DRAFT_394870 [Mariannaea sp. PMI_226]|nr:hypothetical protein BGZ63DRAFT_394870 [Mariannaea sp. PMI_226]